MPDQAQASAQEEELATLRRDWRTYTALTFLYTFGFAVYSGVFLNFMVDDLRATPLQVGGLESIREIPGLLAALLAGFLVALAESRVAGVGLLVMALGVGLTGQFPSYWPVVWMSLFWSVGFHVFSPVSSAITLTLAKGLEGGRHLGRMAAVGSLAQVAGLGGAFLISKAFPNLPYNAYYGLAGFSILVAGLLCFTLSHHASSHRREPFIFRREYGLYYLLTFLDGCRRQILGTFAALTLVAVYKLPVSAMLGLQFVSMSLVVLTAPSIGKLIDRKGERGPLIGYAAFLIAIFAGYATIPNSTILAVLFVIDRVVFSFNVGFSTYLQRIVRPGELTPSLSMGTTMNHVAAVTVPVLGAWLWQAHRNYVLPFWIGVGVALVALLASGLLPRSARTALVPTEPEPAEA